MVEVSDPELYLEELQRNLFYYDQRQRRKKEKKQLLQMEKVEKEIESSVRKNQEKIDKAVENRVK